MKKITNTISTNTEIIQVKTNSFFIDYDKVYIRNLSKFIKSKILNHIFEKSNTIIIVDKSIQNMDNIYTAGLWFTPYTDNWETNSIRFYDNNNKHYYQYVVKFPDLIKLEEYVEFLKYNKIEIHSIYTTLNYTYEQNVLKKLDEIIRMLK